IEAMREIRLAAVFTGEGGLACTQVPMVVDETADGALRLRVHLARANPHWRAIGAGIPALALFQGSHAYVSPGWYETKRTTGKAVPTWAYIAVEARGRLTTIDDPAELRAMLDALTDQNRADQPAPGPWPRRRRTTSRSCCAGSSASNSTWRLSTGSGSSTRRSRPATGPAPPAGLPGHRGRRRAPWHRSSRRIRPEAEPLSCRAGASPWSNSGG
ncbi:MAG: FMN-binding negative transcriptional regulator, partial [Alphaproteobacteria bacterium]|nr:FMN-binding negative transcriptional regulator [Alphaproteobacteria bacterium]